MILEPPSPSFRPPPAIVRTMGFSCDAQFIDSRMSDGLLHYRESISLDDGRRDVHHALAELLDQCNQPNWDLYGATPVSQDAFRNAYRFIEALPQGFPMPTVGAESDGDITLEWYSSPEKVISVSLSPDGDLNYASLLGTSSRRNGAEPFLGEVPSDLLNLIRRVVQA